MIREDLPERVKLILSIFLPFHLSVVLSPLPTAREPSPAGRETETRRLTSNSSCAQPPTRSRKVSNNRKLGARRVQSKARAREKACRLARLSQNSIRSRRSRSRQNYLPLSGVAVVDVSAAVVVVVPPGPLSAGLLQPTVKMPRLHKTSNVPIFFIEPPFLKTVSEFVSQDLPAPSHSVKRPAGTSLFPPVTKYLFAGQDRRRRGKEEPSR
jgi:hypothetical protein